MTNNDYTPTLDEVRLAYIDRQDFLSFVAGQGHLPSDEEYGEQFDRWLTAKVAEGIEMGRALQRGLDESRRGDVMDLGDFTQYIEDGDAQDEERRLAAWGKYRRDYGRAAVPAIGDSHWEFDGGWEAARVGGSVLSDESVDWLAGYEAYNETEEDNS
jgi:hypothetical protein